MDTWIIWLAAALLLGAGELHARGVFLAPLAAGAAVAAAASLAGVGAAALVGQRALVVERIANDEGVGQVKDRR